MVEPSRFKRIIKQNGLLLGNLTGAILGIIFGVVIKSTTTPSPTAKELIAYPGELVIRGLQLLVLPVVFGSLIVGSASLNVKANGRIAIRTFGYFLVTSLFNACMGAVLAIAIHPGNVSLKNELMEISSSGGVADRKNTLLDNFLDLGRNFIPNNIVSAFFEQTVTVYDQNSQDTNGMSVKFLHSRKGWNPLGVIFFALIFGCAMSVLEEKARPLLEVFKSLDLVMMKLITVFIWSTPVGVASLIAHKILDVSDLGSLFTALLTFILTVLIGLIIYQWIILQLLYYVFIRKNPFTFYLGVLPAVITGFAVDSSSIAMPVTLKCLDENVKVDSRISHFVVPIGVTVNMDGTALFICTASIFIAQLNGIALSFGDYVNVIITATLVSIAASGVPSASLTLIFIALQTIGAPLHDVGLLLAIDWLVDRLRTTNNIFGDCYAAALIERWSQDELKAMPTHLGQNDNQEVEKNEDTLGNEV